MQFIATVHFHDDNTDAVAVRVEAKDERDAADQAFAHFQEEGPAGVDVITPAEFEADYGTLTDDMFEAI